MCGIVGIIDNINGKISPDFLASMRDVMVSRGPDGEGNFIDGSVGMAMRRLSIIDLEGGWQPFFSGGNKVVAFQNGEIYNYRELREQLEGQGYVFISQSDTEVLAHGYNCWGMDGLLNRIDGMYAIAILDRDRQELHLARDRFGEKPLFYSYAPDRFAYSSNLIILAALPWVGKDLDPESLANYLALHYVPGDATILRDVHRVLPGERLIIPVNKPLPQRIRYYRPVLGPVEKISNQQLENIIEKAVSSRLVSDVPVGIFLSGGLDSSTVAAIAASKQPRIATFSMGFGSADHDESTHAALVAKRIGSTHYHFVFNEDSFRTLLPQVASSLDEPIGDQALLPVYWLSREARRHVTVVLSGEGADEVFSGYSYYHAFAGRQGFSDQIKKLLGFMPLRSSQLRRLIHNHIPNTPSGFPLLTDSAQRELILGVDLRDLLPWEKNFIDWLESAGTPLQRASAADFASWLPDDLLVKFDRMTMAHSLEGRAPYLYPELVQVGLRLPDTQKIQGSLDKLALRRVARKWLPEEILNRPKQGFVLPMKKWLSQWFSENGPVEHYLSEREVPGLDKIQVYKLIKDDLATGISRERLQFALLMLIEWYQSYCNKCKDLAEAYRKSI